jgi:hypothetical protein
MFRITYFETDLTLIFKFSLLLSGVCTLQFKGVSYSGLLCSHLNFMRENVSNVKKRCEHDKSIFLLFESQESKVG